MLEVDRKCIYLNHVPELHENERPLIIVHHDESTFYANADQTYHWADEKVNVMQQKSLGQAIIVSDFIEEATGDYLKHNSSEARLILETQSDGYFNRDKFLHQVDRAITIFENKFPHVQGLFFLTMPLLTVNAVRIP